MGFVDLHAHYLPALDDGARDRGMAMQMVNAIVGLGFDRLEATPHQRAGMFMPEPDAIDAAFAWLKDEATAAHPGLQLGLGAENFWDEVLLVRLQRGRPADLRRRPGVPVRGDPAADAGPARADAVRVAAHGAAAGDGASRALPGRPERPARAEELGRTAALVVDLGALDGAHGRAEMKTARRLLEEGLAHAAATDIHSPDDQRPIAAGMAWIRKRLGPEALRGCWTSNPRHILAGELP